MFFFTTVCLQMRIMSESSTQRASEICGTKKALDHPPPIYPIYGVDRMPQFGMHLQKAFILWTT